LSVNAVRGKIKKFRPEAVLTVHERFGWIVAEEFAQTNGIPLHLILHDEWFRNLRPSQAFERHSNRYFAPVYQRAASRLCVSPYMAEQYAELFGASGSVLYPSWAPGVQPKPAPERLRIGSAKPKAFYAGNIFGRGAWRALQILAETLAPSNGTLVLHSPVSASQAATEGLTAQNVELRGLVSWSELVTAIRNEAEFLFLPMSFDSEDARNMCINFPSKLADYTTTGVPVLIYGPLYSSAVRWGQENPDAAVIVGKDSPTELRAAVKRILSDGVMRHRLGTNAGDTGRKFFSHEVVERQFFRHLAERGNLRLEAGADYHRGELRSALASKECLVPRPSA
jgi:hypothetical protein